MDDPSPFEFRRVGVRVHGMSRDTPDAHEPCDPAWLDCRDTPLSFPKGGVFGVCQTARAAPESGREDPSEESAGSPASTPANAGTEALRLIDQMKSDLDTLSEDEAETDASIVAHIEQGVRCARNTGGHRSQTDAQSSTPDDDDTPPSAA